MSQKDHNPPQGPPPSYPQPPPQAHYDPGQVYGSPNPTPSPQPYYQPPGPGGAADYYGGNTYNGQQQYPPGQDPYQQGPSPSQQGPYPPQQGMYYGGPPQGYYADDRGRRSNDGLIAICLGALACCCCLDCIF